MIYSIKKWDQFFENNRTRELKHMDWVPIPNQMDGDGYTELLDHPDGAAHFGAWIAIVEIASRCTPRGVLVRSAPHDVGTIPQAPAEGVRTPLRPHDPTSLSRISRLPASIFEAVIPRLISIGWLTSETVVSNRDTSIPQDCAAQSAESRRTVRESDYGTERNGTEEETPPSPPEGDGAGVAAEGQPLGFVAFWNEWPSHFRKKGRSKCIRQWQKAKLEPMALTIVDAVRRLKKSEQWTKQGGQFIPGPLPWLNDEGWEAVAGKPAGETADDNGFVRAPWTREKAEACGMPWPIPMPDGSVIGD